MIFARIFSILLLLLSVSGQAQETAPNIILIITDQHSGLIMSQQGYPHLETPGIDKIAKEGVTFTRSYCTNPVCTSSRKSFMAGLMPSQLDDLTDHTSIGKALESGGYETAYFGKWHVGSTEIEELDDWHGFQTYLEGRDDSDIAGWSRDYLQLDHNKPFFMITSFLNPHDCCELARNISGENDNYHDGSVEEHKDTAYCPPLPDNFAIPIHEAEGFYGRRDQDPGDEYWNAHPTKLWSEVEWRQYLYGYDRLVEKVDVHIESLYDELASLGLLENTVIIYTSDHGDGHASHQWNQKKTFYEESVNIPFIVSWKGKSKMNTIEEQTLVSNGLDMYPTILSFAGLSPQTLPGIDLSPVILSNSTENISSRNYVVSEISQKIYNGYTPGTFTGRMLVTEHFKYILFDKGVNREQLFDLELDPGELNPVTNDPYYNSELSVCRDMLKEWCGKIGDSFDVDEIVAEYESTAMLDSILINNKSLTGFSPEIFYYVVEPGEDESVVISAVPVNSEARIIIDQVSDIRGDSAARSARVLVISEDGMKANAYYIQIDGEEIVSDVQNSKIAPFKIYQDPVFKKLYLETAGEEIKNIKIYNSGGQLIYSDAGDFLQPWINIGFATGGIYLMEVATSQDRYNQAFIIH